MTKGFLSPVYLVLGALIVVGVLAGVYYLRSPQTPPTKIFPAPTQKACTMEAKICPDGTSVGRTGPNCEFAACPATKVDETTDWKTYSSDCGLTVKYPPEWTVEKYFITPEGYCAYMIAPDYQSGLDSRTGFYLSLQRIPLGAKRNGILINSISDYIKSNEQIFSPPEENKTKQNKIVGSFTGIQFDPVGYEAGSEFVFIYGKYLYHVSWPNSNQYQGPYSSNLDQILRSIKFTN